MTPTRLELRQAEPDAQPARPLVAAIPVEVVVVRGPGVERTIRSLQQARCVTEWTLTIADEGTDTTLPREHGRFLSASSQYHHSAQRDLVMIRAGIEVADEWLDRLRLAVYASSDCCTATPFGDPFVPYPPSSTAPVSESLANLAKIAGNENVGRSLPLPRPGHCCVYTRGGMHETSANTANRSAHVLAADVLVGWSGTTPNANGDSENLPVRSFLENDTAQLLRRRIDVTRLAGPQPAMLLITHVGGGGTERHVRDLSEWLEAEGVRAIVLRPTVNGKMRIERFAVPSATDLVFEPSAEFYTMLTVMERLGITHAHVHHMLGHPPTTQRLLTSLRVPYDVTIHDYYLACPRIHMTQAAGRYCGEPDDSGCNRCLARFGHHVAHTTGTMEITKWRRQSDTLLRGARRVFVPDPDVRDRFQRYFPDVATELRPHFDRSQWAKRVATPWTEGEVVRVVLLGNVVPGKGPELLLACAQDALKRQLPLAFSVVGILQPHSETLPENVTVTGAYDESEVFDLLARFRPHLALFPSTVPETFCYTLSIGFAGGLYCIGIDLGAIGRRIRESGRGELFPLNTPPSAINDLLLEAAHRAAALTKSPVPEHLWKSDYASLLTDYYQLRFTPEPVKCPPQQIAVCSA